MNGDVPDFVQQLLDRIEKEGGLGERPAVILIVTLEGDCELFTFTGEPADLPRLAEYVMRDGVMVDMMDTLEDFASEHAADPDVTPRIGPVLAAVVRLQLRERLKVIIAELGQVDADVDVPLTIAEGLLEDALALLAEEIGLADYSEDEAEAA